MFINDINNMYNFDITSIVKSHVVPNGRLRETQVMFIDFVYEGEKENDEVNPFSALNPMVKSSPTTTILGPKVFTKNLSDETVKNTFLSHTNDIFEEILNCYYDMYLEGKKDSVFPKFEYNSTEDIRRLVSKCITAGSTIAMESRRGPGNVVILPNKKYEQDIRQVYRDAKVIINPTELHKDKIFVIRVDSDSSSPGLSLFLSRSLAPIRYMKLVKLMSKMGRNLDDLSFSYILAKVGFHSETFVQVVHLT